LPAFLVTATILVEADDEIQASHKALAKILTEPSIAFDVQFDAEIHARVMVEGNKRHELLKQAGFFNPNNADHTP
jgi:hypothetical protein